MARFSEKARFNWPSHWLRPHWLLLLVLTLFITGCSNNPLAWKLLYGQFDNFMAKEFLSYAEFSDAQTARIRQEVDNTVRWHRQQELPRYATMITEFQQRMLTKSMQRTDVDWLFDNLTEIGRRFDERSPLPSLIPVLAELNTQQATQVTRRLMDEFEESRRERAKRANQDPVERGTRSLQKFFSRLGLRLTKEQKTRIAEQLKRRRLTDEIEDNIWRQWVDKFNLILAQRQGENFAAVFSEHYFSRLTLMKTSVPELWHHDQRVNKELVFDLFNSLDADQIDSMQQGLDKLKTVALELSSS